LQLKPGERCDFYCVKDNLGIVKILVTLYNKVNVKAPVGKSSRLRGLSQNLDCLDPHYHRAPLSVCVSGSINLSPSFLQVFSFPWLFWTS